MLIEYKIKELAIDRKYNSTLCNNRYLFPTLKDWLFIIYICFPLMLGRYFLSLTLYFVF